MNPVTPGPTHPPGDPNKWSEQTKGWPIVVPPDKNPAGRAHGDLLGTLTTLQETYGALWLRDDIVVAARRQTSPEVRLVGQLIATAVEQCEKLTVPEGVVAMWIEEAVRLINEIRAGLSDWQGTTINNTTQLLAHLAAMPSPPDVAVLETIRDQLDYPLLHEDLDTEAWMSTELPKLADWVRDVIAYTKKRAAMPAPPDVNTALLTALRDIDTIGAYLYPGGADVMDTNPFAKQIRDIWRIAHAAIAQAEEVELAK